MIVSYNKLRILIFILLIQFNQFAWAEPAVTVEITAPDGSAASEFSESLMSTILYSPCLSVADTDGNTSLGNVVMTNPFDQLSVSLTITNDIDDNGAYLYDLYFMLVNLSANGTSNDNLINSQIYLFERKQDGSDKLDPVSVNLFGTAEAADLSTSEKKYLPKTQFISTKYTETVFGSSIYFDSFSLAQGTWMALSILGKDGFKFADPKTWVKWDAGVFVLGSPLKTSIGSSGEGVCN